MYNYALDFVNELKNITCNNRISPNIATDYTITLTANYGYTLPEDVTITVDDVTLTKSIDYTFENGVLIIDAEKLNGNISIAAAAEKIENLIQFASSDIIKLRKHILEISNTDDISSLDVNQDNQLT